MCSVFPALLGLGPGVRMLVAGGTGVVGSGVTISALKQGAKVTVVTRCYERFEELMNTIPDQFRPFLSVVVGDVQSEKGVRRIFAESTQKSGGVQHVVAAINSNIDWQKKGDLVDQSLESFQTVTHEEASPHFLLMKAFLPYLAPQTGSTYTVVTGYPLSSVEEPPTNSLQAVASGTVKGLVDGARLRCLTTPVAVSELRLKCLVHRKLDDEMIVRDDRALGHDLVGKVVTALASSGVRDTLVLDSRALARKWAGCRDPDPCAARPSPFTGKAPRNEARQHFS